MPELLPYAVTPEHARFRQAQTAIKRGGRHTVRVDLRTDISGETISSATPVMLTFLRDSSTRLR